MNSARRVEFDPLSRDFGSCESFFLTNIYQLLCNVQSPGWFVPVTVVYSTSTATLFQSDSDGRVTVVQPKLHQKVSDIILQAFLPSALDVASALQSVSAWEKEGKSQDIGCASVVAVLVKMSAPSFAGKNSLKVQYLDQHQLIRYICLEKKESGAILQEFVQPGRSNHSVIRTWYTPALCSHEVCTSTVGWLDGKQPVNLRFCDFDGNQQFMRIDTPHSNVARTLGASARSLVKDASSCLRKHSSISCMAVYFQWRHGRPCFLYVPPPPALFFCNNLNMYCGGAQVHFNSSQGDGSRVGPYVPSSMLSAGVAQKLRACVMCKAPLSPLQSAHSALPVAVNDLVFFFKRSAQPPVRWQVPAFAAISQCFAMDDKTAIGCSLFTPATSFL